MAGGTAAEYIDPDEVLEDAFYFCRRMRETTIWSGLNESGRAAIDQFEKTLRERGNCVDHYTHSNIRNLVERDTDWAALRQGACDVIQHFGKATPR